MKSMTGHGAGSASNGGFRARAECFSVNRKSVEVAFSAPRELSALEPLVREKVLTKISRGRVNVSVHAEAEVGAGSSVDLARARAYHTEVQNLKEALGLGGEIALETVLAGPGVIRASESGDAFWPAVEEALDAALDGLVEMRAKEGRNLYAEIGGHVDALSALVAEARTLAADIPGKYRETLFARLARSGLGIDLADQRVVAEIALFAERCDVSEELARLESHIGQFRETSAAGGACGRTLEFLVQEMGREWNTVGSKSGGLELSRTVISAKGALDKIREQIANVE